MIDKNTTIAKALEQNEDAAEILMSIGMHCLGCPMSRGETIEQAARAHGVDLDGLLSRLNGK